MRKKVISRAAASLLLALVFMAGCSSSSPPSASPSDTPPPSNQQSSGNEQQPSAPAELRRFTIFTSDVNAKKLPLDSPVANQVRDLYNVEFEWIVPATDARERLAIMLAGNESELPDLIYFSDRTMMQQYISAGKLLKMNDYLADYAPDVLNVNFKSSIDRINDKDGNLYFLPRYYNTNPDEYLFPENTTAFWLKSEFLDQNDLWDMVPLKTLDDVTNLLRLVKEKTNQIPISFALGADGRLDNLTYFGVGACGLKENTEGVVLEDDKIMYVFENDKMKRFFKWVNSLNQEGLMDIESPLLSVDSLKEKVVNEQVFSSIVWGYWTLSSQYNLYHQAQTGDDSKLMFFQYPVLDSSVTQPSFTRSSVNGATTGTTVTVNMKNPEDFFRFYGAANTEEGHFNVLGTVNWEFEGENTLEEAEGYNFVASKEPGETGKRTMGISEWTWEMMDTKEEWGWQWGFESLIEFTYNTESNVPNSVFDITQSLYRNSDTGNMDRVWTLAGEQNGKVRWDQHRKRWIDISEIAGFQLSDDVHAIKAAMKIATDRILPRVVMAANDAEFEKEWNNLLTELKAVGMDQYVEANRVAYEERKAIWE